MTPKEEREALEAYVNQAYERSKTVFIKMMAPLLVIVFASLAFDPNRPKSPAQMNQGVLVEHNRAEGWASFRDNGKTVKIATDQSDLVVGKKYAVVRWKGTYRWGHFVTFKLKAI